MGECKNCHGLEAIKPWPENHAAFTSDICANCHQPAQSGGAPAATSTPEDDEANGESEGPPAIPHDLAGRDNCLVCHNPDGGMKPAPANHAGRTTDTCQTCHRPAATQAATPEITPEATSTPSAAGAQAGPPAIPHDLAGRDNCLMCHDPNGGLKPAPADHAGRTVDMCQTCHKPEN
jgi:hypothetical protein